MLSKFKVEHKTNKYLTIVYAVRVNEDGNTLFLIYDDNAKNWIWDKADNYEPYELLDLDL